MQKMITRPRYQMFSRTIKHYDKGINQNLFPLLWSVKFQKYITCTSIYLIKNIDNSKFRDKLSSSSPGSLHTGYSHQWKNKPQQFSTYNGRMPQTISGNQIMARKFYKVNSPAIYSPLLVSNNGFKRCLPCSECLRISEKHSSASQADTQFELKKQVLWHAKEDLIKDIQETKAKVKETVGEVIERENIWTIPNLLCVGRIAISPYLCYTVITSCYSLSLGIFLVAGFTDLIDGMIARAFPSQASRLGSFLDPLADKILISSLFLTLTYVGIIPFLLTGIIVYRDAIIICGASYVRYKSLPPPFTWSRYFEASHATAQLAPTFISKLNTAVQLGLITCSLAAPVFSFTDHSLLHGLWLVTSVTTIWSGMSYIFSKDTYKILKKG